MLDKRNANSNHHPLAPLDWIAHSSSSSGVSAFIFYVDGQELSQINTQGERFELVETSWEPLQPGIYTLEVLAVDAKGVKGSPASSLVYIGDAGVVPRQVAEATNGQCEGVAGMRLKPHPTGTELLAHGSHFPALHPLHDINPPLILRKHSSIKISVKLHVGALFST